MEWLSLCSFVHGERLLALWATTVTQEEPTRETATGSAPPLIKEAPPAGDGENASLLPNDTPPTARPRPRRTPLVKEASASMYIRLS